ncbi:hypothetical protein BDR06DRAFT_1051460 [Suillus hirtellus]|nr:hypothetical protein BDR06DRAFT_1051460 [Suillus hirtellus]
MSLTNEFRMTMALEIPALGQTCNEEVEEDIPMLSKITNEFRMAVASLEIPLSGCTCLNTAAKVGEEEVEGGRTNVLGNIVDKQVQDGHGLIADPRITYVTLEVLILSLNSGPYEGIGGLHISCNTLVGVLARSVYLRSTKVCYTFIHLFSPTQSLSPKSSTYTWQNQCIYPAKMRINNGRKQQGPPAGPPPPPYPPLSGGPNDPPLAPIALHNLLTNLSPDVLLALVAQAVQGQPQQNLPHQNHIPQSLPPSDQHTIQPDLETVSDVQALWSICKNLQHKVNCLKCGHKDDGDEADDEDKPTDKGMHQKKKKKLTKDKIQTYLLNCPLQEISAAEKTTCEELQECLDTAIFDVTGTSMDTIETDDSDGGDANIVWNEQNFMYVGFGKDREAETCTLGHKDISFTKKDIIVFTKDKFWNLKCKYAEVMDSSKRAKHQKQKVVNKRKKCCKQLCKDRADPSVIEAYTKEYGTDPTLLLETDYMSEELSELETDNEEKKKAHHKMLLCGKWFFNDIVEWIDKIRTVKDHAPEILVYPFMLSNDWLAKFNQENPGASLDIKMCNLRGFGPIDNQLDTQEQDNHSPGTTPEYGGGEANHGDDLDDGDM